MKCLFIGGHASGKIIDIADGRPFIEMPELTSTPSRFLGVEIPGSKSYKNTIYRLDFATDRAGKKHMLYVAEGSGDPLLTLMQFYADGDHSAEKSK